MFLSVEDSVPLRDLGGHSGAQSVPTTDRAGLAREEILARYTGAALVQLSPMAASANKASAETISLRLRDLLQLKH